MILNLRICSTLSINYIYYNNLYVYETDCWDSNQNKILYAI